MVTEKEIKHYYNSQYRNRGECACRPTAAFGVYLDLLGAAGGRILDIGCGTGSLLQEAHRRGLEGYGIDISEEGAKIARASAPHAEISVGRAEKLDFPASRFDYITCIGVLEHLLDMEAGLKEMVRVTKPEGRMCMVVPNRDFLYWKLSRTKGTEQQEINEQLLTLGEWKEFFSSCGLAVLDVRQDSWWFRKKYADLRGKNLLQAAKSLLNLLKWSVLPLRYTYQFVFILKVAREP